MEYADGRVTNFSVKTNVKSMRTQNLDPADQIEKKTGPHLKEIEGEVVVLRIGLILRKTEATVNAVDQTEIMGRT
jgi:hypothetical protein